VSIPLRGDRSAWDASHYPTLHADDMAAGDSHHPVVTLGATADVLLGVSGQALSLDTQAANTALLGPTTGADAAPTFRALVAADLPASVFVKLDGSTAGATAQAQTFNKGLVVNENGDDSDTRIEGDTEANLLLVDASADTVYLGGTTNGVKIAKGGALTCEGTATLPATRLLWGWAADTAQNPALGTLPAHSYVLRVHVQVTEAFDSDGTDELTVGYDADPDAYATTIDVSTTGSKTVTLGAGAGYDATSRSVKAYYTNGGTEPTTGAALILVEYATVGVAP
jgi:hypothetical protein